QEKHGGSLADTQVHERDRRYQELREEDESDSRVSHQHASVFERAKQEEELGHVDGIPRRRESQRDGAVACGEASQEIEARLPCFWQHRYQPSPSYSGCETRRNQH